MASRNRFHLREHVLAFQFLVGNCYFGSEEEWWYYLILLPCFLVNIILLCVMVDCTKLLFS